MSSRIVLVTGANRGIGQAIVQALATRCPNDHYLLGTRDRVKGEKAIKELRDDHGIQSSKMDVVTMDVTSDDSIQEAEREIRERYGRLDVLINNAGIALIPSSQSPSDVRTAFNTTLNTNLSSIACVTTVFLPLLKMEKNSDSGSSRRPQIINVSSARGSIGLNAAGKLPPTVSPPYSVSKAALNALTVEFAKTPGNEDVEFQCAAPGHCRTAFNGFRGRKEPLDGARVVVELVNAEKGKFGSGGFWEMEGDQEGPTAAPW